MALLLLAWGRPALAAPSFHDHLERAALRDQNGKPLSRSALQGKLTLVNFIFTRCSTVCPVQTRALVEVQQALPAATRRQVQFVSVSLDPLSDTPATLKAYARSLGADSAGWSFVTGNPVGIDVLSDQLRLFKSDSTTRRPDDHATQLWLIDGAGQVLMRYGGTPPDVARLTRELAVAPVAALRR